MLFALPDARPLLLRRDNPLARGLLLRRARGIARICLAVPLGARAGRGREPVVLVHRGSVDVVVELGRVGDDLLRHRDAHLLFGVVDVCELPGQGVLRLPQGALLDDEEVPRFVDDLPDFVVIDRDDVIVFHCRSFSAFSGHTPALPGLSGSRGNSTAITGVSAARVGPMSDARRLAEGARDRVQFEEEALALADQVYRVARGVSRSKEEAEDLMQETYARAFRSWQSYTPGTNLRAWLLRILTNLNIDRGRRKQRAPEMQPLEEGDYFLYNKLEESSREPVSDQDAVVERLSQDDVVAALSSVPHDFRDVLVLVDIGDFTYQDAAQILDIPIGTVMSRLHRGRRILKRELADRATGGT